MFKYNMVYVLNYAYIVSNCDSHCLDCASETRKYNSISYLYMQRYVAKKGLVIGNLWCADINRDIEYLKLFTINSLSFYSL